MDFAGNPSQPSRPDPGSGSERGVGELLLAALTGSALAPFIQGVVTKAGEDVYTKIKDRLQSRRRAAEAGPIVLADPLTRIAVELPATLPTSEAARLAAVRIPESGNRDWLLVQYQPGRARWTIRVVPEPPATAIRLDPDEPA
ncbi:hypothetical protein ACTI_45550 [Actinoplanes sp. OR16]|uniref:hypothetical protein n=1 Tax=Actinoplanes sp. OR16 TaxID=946334 RepID=UPI000F6D6A10|nr:hypothetical protein [Actinoplanes sp. OR16]BBH67870.1 hypothetical protein ACTI_45550 [Actinoplanes sp. OR16]